MAKQLNNMVPPIRFKRFEKNWEENSIAQILSETKRTIVLRDDQKYQLITVKRRNEGVVSRGYLWGREILVKNYSQLEAGDFVISKRQVVHGATGIVPPELNKAIVSNEYLVAVGNSKITTEFLTILASLREMRKKFFLSSYGVVIEKLFFDAEDWKKRTVKIPEPSEQGKISSFVKAIDLLIGLQQRKHDKLVALKKAMLQKMFPKGGATTPEIRFKGFYTPWNSIEMEKFGQPYAGLFGKSKEDFGQGDGRYVTYIGVFNNAVSNLNMTAVIGVDRNQNEVRKGDVLFTISSETPNEVGMSSVWSEDIPHVYLNSFCFGFRPHPHLHSDFLAYVFRANDFRKKISFLAQGISRYNISKTKVMKIPVSIPTPEEQQKIGTYFRALDGLISRQAIQLEKFKQIKSACLEKMFV